MELVFPEPIDVPAFIGNWSQNGGWLKAMKGEWEVEHLLRVSE